MVRNLKNINHYEKLLIQDNLNKIFQQDGTIAVFQMKFKLKYSILFRMKTSSGLWLLGELLFLIHNFWMIKTINIIYMFFYENFACGGSMFVCTNKVITLKWVEKQYAF